MSVRACVRAYVRTYVHVCSVYGVCVRVWCVRVCVRVCVCVCNAFVCVCVTRASYVCPIGCLQ